MICIRATATVELRGGLGFKGEARGKGGRDGASSCTRECEIEDVGWSVLELIDFKEACGYNVWAGVFPYEGYE